ncbi:16S rRNA (guanine(527)-N(7))-methyltransferase RsmG [Novosphingobium sp. RD2P27]|uniref:Ribosomal RNA small subunit methyltransferase G n=2 Tax=Novosphingobium kalidii TaxID=3230299 RepID=A0ABV2D5N6_9SPHN
MATFISLLAEENARQNLVASSSLGMVWQRHIADSAQLLTHVPRETDLSWLDLGTGAGFPGLVISILRPDVHVTMVESRARRIDWLERVCAHLELEHAKVEGMRIEHVPERPFSVISARAFAPLPQLLDRASRFSTGATTWLLPKGRSASQEVLELRGWEHVFHVEPSLTDSEAGIIIGTLLGRKG